MGLTVTTRAEQRIREKLAKRQRETAAAVAACATKKDWTLTALQKDTTALEALECWQDTTTILADLPVRFERQLLSEFISRARTDIHNAQGWVWQLFNKIRKANIPFSAIGSDETAAAWALQYCKQKTKIKYLSIFAHYEALAKKAEFVGFSYPKKAEMTPEEVAEAVAIMSKPEWWQRKAKVAAARAREYIAIYRGLVSVKAKPYQRTDGSLLENGTGKMVTVPGDTYLSHEGLTSYRARMKKGEEFLAANYIAIESDSGIIHGSELCLADASASSVANPENRRLELMARIRGTEEAATAAGMASIFVTWTAPAQWHRNSEKKWNGADPTDTQAYLSKQWAKCRATIKKAGIKFCGLRVTEPHNDETPHWHLLLFVRKGERKELIRIMRHFACQHDKHELTGEHGIKPRFYVEYIKPSQGSAVGYIAKYISKSINGKKNETELDDETGEMIPDVAEKVRGWASTWSIRQFQFVGTPSVTLWRELRRERDTINTEPGAPLSKADLIHHAANRGNFSAYIRLMGGVAAGRAACAVELAKSEYKNSDGFIKEKISGFMAGEFVKFTREAWVKVGKLNLKEALQSALLLLQGGSRAARTCGNNCNLAEVANEKINEWRQLKKAVVGYINRFGEWITEQIEDYEAEHAAEF
jgi:hypothetical protein